MRVSLILLALTPFSYAKCLAKDALKEILSRGAPILGEDSGCSSDSSTCDWMAKVPDETQLVHMNLPGTHDAATWNYSQATQDSLIRYTGSSIVPAQFFRCQEHSLFDMLNGGIRVFDLRFSWNPGNDTVGFYHAAALLSPTTRLEDVFFGFYSWLDRHPTETLLVSMNYEGGPGREDTEKLQEHNYNVFESPLAKRYWVQEVGKLGTLGESRGKIILLQRWAYTLLPPTLTDRIGIPLLPDQWTPNGADIELVYNEDEGRVATFFEPHPPPTEFPDNRAEISIRWKFNATVAHLTRAADTSNASTKDQFFITFASGENSVEGVTPVMMATGNGTSTPEGGVNQRLLAWLQGQDKKGRRGVVLLDFFDTVPGLVEAVIGL